MRITANHHIFAMGIGGHEFVRVQGGMRDAGNPKKTGGEFHAFYEEIADFPWTSSLEFQVFKNISAAPVGVSEMDDRRFVGGTPHFK
jgi:hypothetical protein